MALEMKLTAKTEQGRQALFEFYLTDKPFGFAQRKLMSKEVYWLAEEGCLIVTVKLSKGLVGIENNQIVFNTVRSNLKQEMRKYGITSKNVSMKVTKI